MAFLKPITTDHDVLRSILAADNGEDDWEFYDHDSAEQDGIYCAAIRRLDDWLTDHPVNGGDGVDITLVADLDGTIEGYEFAYSTRAGQHSLNLNCGYREWKDMRGGSDGIEGVTEFLTSVIHVINGTLHDTSLWLRAKTYD